MKHEGVELSMDETITCKSEVDVRGGLRVQKGVTDGKGGRGKDDYGRG